MQMTHAKIGTRFSLCHAADAQKGGARVATPGHVSYLDAPDKGALLSFA
jgi:hypothetical protein